MIIKYNDDDRRNLIIDLVILLKMVIVQMNLMKIMIM